MMTKKRQRRGAVRRIRRAENRRDRNEAPIRDAMAGRAARLAVRRRAMTG